MTEQRLTDEQIRAIFKESVGGVCGSSAITFARAILSADRGEPVAWKVIMANGEEDYWPCDPATMMLDPQFYDVPSKVIPLYAAAPSTPQPAPEQVPVETLLEWAVLDGVVRLSKVMDADLQDALRKFASRFGATPQPDTVQVPREGA